MLNFTRRNNLYGAIVAQSFDKRKAVSASLTTGKLKSIFTLNSIIALFKAANFGMLVRFQL